MSDCGYDAKADSLAQWRVLSIALGLNTTMLVVGFLWSDFSEQRRALNYWDIGLEV